MKTKQREKRELDIIGDEYGIRLERVIRNIISNRFMLIEGRRTWKSFEVNVEHYGKSIIVKIYDNLNKLQLGKLHIDNGVIEVKNYGDF